MADAVWCSGQYVRERRAALEAWDAPLVQAPDLCIEIASPSSLHAELEEKAALYVAAGAREVWIVRRELSIEVHTAMGRAAGASLGVPMHALVERIQALLA